LLSEQLTATLPLEVNVVEEAGLQYTVSIDVFETVTETVTPEARGRPGVVEAQVLHRLTINDSETIRQMLGALDTVVPLRPRVKAAVPYVVQFHLQDGTSKAVGYSSGGHTFWILRVDQLRHFRRQDAEPPAGFEALITGLLAAKQEDAKCAHEEPRVDHAPD
jgi:hypothetical protein